MNETTTHVTPTVNTTTATVCAPKPAVNNPAPAAAAPANTNPVGAPKFQPRRQGRKQH